MRASVDAHVAAHNPDELFVAPNSGLMPKALREYMNRRRGDLVVQEAAEIGAAARKADAGRVARVASEAAAAVQQVCAENGIPWTGAQVDVFDGRLEIIVSLPRALKRWGKLCQQLQGATRCFIGEGINSVEVFGQSSG